MHSALSPYMDEYTDKYSSPKVIKTPQALELEAMGTKTWLRTLFPRSFKAPFCHEQEQFWYYAWNTMQKRWAQVPLTVKEYSILVPFCRGLGKSTNGEALCILEGAYVGEGYDLYLSDTDDMAEDHLYNIAELINQGQVEQFYPLLANPRINQLTGEQAEFSKKTLITEGNWGVTAKGLRGNVRGSRKGTLRFTMILGDDIDRLDEGMVVVLKKERNLSRSVLGAGTTRMQFWFLQNVIEETSIMNRMLTGKTDVCSERVIVGSKPTKAFKELEMEPYVGDDGIRRYRIVREKTVPTWDYFDLDAAEKFLAQSGRAAFMAEYQHEFDEKKDKVISTFNHKAQVITWSMFKSVFKTAYIPEAWTKSCAVDFGYTERSNSAWAWTATSPKNSPLPDKRFTFRAHTFVGESVDRQMLRFWKSQFPDPSVGRNYFESEMHFGLYPELFRLLYLDPKCRPYLEQYTYDSEMMLWRHPSANLEPFFNTQTDAFQCSHEKSGELLTIREKYGVPVQKIKNFGAEDGVSQWKQMCVSDHTVPHPFLDDTIVIDDETGEQIWALGCPELFYVVSDDEYESPVSDAGMKKNLENVAKWRYVLQNITEGGVADPKPIKLDSDTCDAERAIYSTFGPDAKPLTKHEKFDRHVQDKQPHLTDQAIERLPRDAQGFAQVEKQIVQKQWEKANTETIRPKGLENLDF